MNSVTEPNEHDMNLYSEDGVPVIRIPRLCPYCHQSHVQFETKTQVLPTLGLMYLTCPSCGVSSAPYEFDTGASVVDIQYRIMKQWLRQIAMLPAFMLLRPGDDLLLKDSAHVTAVTTPLESDHNFLVTDKEGRVFMIAPSDIDSALNDRIKRILKH